MSSDPFENIRRQQERLQRALRVPLESLARNHVAIEQALAQPMRDLARVQEQAAAAMQTPGLRAFETQGAINRALQAPLRDIARTHGRVQQALQGPLDQITRNQEALNRALTAPYAALLRNQELFLNAMRAAAAAAELEVDDGGALQAELSREEAWLSQWRAVVREWSPSAEQAQGLLRDIAYLLALVAFAIAIASPESNTDELLTAASLLFGAGAYATWFVSRRG